MIKQSRLRSFNAKHSAVAFPLGGIGTGNVSLGARGNLCDWEIFNAPAKGRVLPNTFFALRTQMGDQPPIMRVLEGPIQPPYTLSHGYHPTTNAGLPRFSDTVFYGEYPFANIDFIDDALPVHVQLEAFTPLIPLNPEDSGIPGAMLTYEIENTSDEPVQITLVGSLCNPVGGVRLDPFSNITLLEKGSSVNKYRLSDTIRGLFMYADSVDPQDLHYGSASLVTTHPQVTVKPIWLRGGWWDFLQEFWDDLMDDGRLTDLHYDQPATDRHPDTGSIGIYDTLKPGEKRKYEFYLTWYFPNRLDTWRNPEQVENASSVRQSTPTGKANQLIRNHYATRFEDAWSVAAYLDEQRESLEQRTRQFHESLFGTTLPAEVIDALAMSIVPVRSTTCFWLEDGRFYGWEGCFDNAGCCAGTCTHVWSYAQTVAFLFPSLEREMRRIEFAIETEDDGFMNFRNFKSTGDEFVWAWGNQKPEAAVDGQMGSILRAYREWQLSADKEWLRALWPAIKNSVDYASVHWDTDHDHVLDGRQHNTYDIEFYGPNPLSSIYYLAALRAVEELAHVMDEADVARRCRSAFEAGSKRLDEMLWNGEFFIQALDDVNAYRYQHGKGCLSDQLLGQLHARILNLGDLLPQEHIRQAVQAIYRYNFRRDFREHSNSQRTYVLNDEAGLVLCSWPQGGRPQFPFVYSDEVWTGIEYQVAAHLIYEGWVTEGLEMVKAVRDRHDGVRRNPWNEVECGHHYARSMSAWALLLALSGVHADLGQNKLEFAPRFDPADDSQMFTSFWSTGRAWGRYTQRKNPTTGVWSPEIEVLGGSLDDMTVTACGISLKFTPDAT